MLKKQKAHAKLMTAFRNITKAKENPNGLEYTGRIFEKAIEYPIGTYRDMSGIEKPLEDIDGLWLATKAATDIDQVAAYEMVTRWFLSSENPNTAQTRLKVLSEIANTTETKVTGIGYKMILHRDQYGHQQTECTDQQHEAHALPGRDRHHHGHDACAQAEHDVKQVADHVVQGVARLQRRHFGRSRSDHHQPQTEQGQATGEQREVEVDATPVISGEG